MSRFDRLQRAFAKADFWDSSTGGVGGHSRGGPGNSSGFDGNSSYGSNFDATSPGWGYGPTRGELGAGPAGDSSGDIGLMSFAERMIKNPGAVMNARADAAIAERRAQAESARRAELAAAREAMINSPNVGWDAVRAFDLGEVKALRGLGFPDQAEALTRHYSAPRTTFGGIVSGLFSSAPPDRVMTPRASLNAGLAAGHIGANSTNDGYSITPAGYMAALAAPAKAFGGFAVGGLLGGGLPGALGSLAFSRAYDAISSPTSPLDGLGTGLGIAKTAAGLSGLSGLADAAGVAKGLASAAGQGLLTAGIGRGLEAARAAPERTARTAQGLGGGSDADTSALDDNSALTASLARQGGEASGLLVDPAAWFANRRGLMSR